MTDNKMQTDFTPPRKASSQEMKRAAKWVVATMQVHFNKKQDRITRVVSKLTGAEIFNVYEMVGNISSEEELYHTINSCLTAIFAAAFSQCAIPSCQFDITTMEELVALEFRKLSEETKNEQ